MLDYLNKILKEGEDNEYTQEQYDKSQRDLRKVKLILKHIRPDKSLCCFHVVAFPAYNEIYIYPIFSLNYTPRNELKRIQNKINAALGNNIKASLKDYFADYYAEINEKKEDKCIKVNTKKIGNYMFIPNQFDTQKYLTNYKFSPLPLV